MTPIVLVGWTQNMLTGADGVNPAWFLASS